MWLNARSIVETSLRLLFVALFLAACGGRSASPGGSAGESSDSSGDASALVVPTMPPARFTAVGQQSFVTKTVSITTAAPITTAPLVTSSASTAGSADLTRGANAYMRNNCAECHGENGEGVAGKGKAIVGTTLTESEFTDLLRTGGGLGNTHIFGPSAISPGGMAALYMYVQSFQ